MSFARTHSLATLLSCCFPFLPERTCTVTSLGKEAQGMSHSGHWRTNEGDAVSQLITEKESGLLVSQSNNLESLDPKQHNYMEFAEYTFI